VTINFEGGILFVRLVYVDDSPGMGLCGRTDPCDSQFSAFIVFVALGPDRHLALLVICSPQLMVVSECFLCV
jgi:hypothetical protein